MRFVTLALLLVSAVALALPAAHADTVFHYSSDPGDIIGRGLEETLTPTEGYTFNVSGGFGAISFYIFREKPSPVKFYNVTFGPAFNGTLTTGEYLDATIAPLNPTLPQLNFESNGTSNDTITGHFEILEITYDTDGKLATFAANFVQHSEGRKPASYGQIRYNSDVPYLTPAGVANLSSENYSVVQSAAALTVTVDRRDGSSGPLSVDYSTAAGTAVAGRDYTPVSGTLSWADGDKTSKTFTVPILNSGDPTQPDETFLVNLGAGAGEQAQATATILTDNNAVTYVHFDYDDFTSLSRERLFNRATGFPLKFSINGDGGVSLVFNNDTSAGIDPASAESWVMDFAPAATAAFAVGDYQNAVGFDRRDATHPAINVQGPFFYSNPASGNFQVLEVQLNADGALQKFAAHFVYMSQDGIHQQRGEVRYNSTIPTEPDHGAIEFTQDSFGVPQDCGEATIIVNRVGGSAGTQRVSYSAFGMNSAMSGIDFVPVSGTLDWADGDAAPKTFQVPVLNAPNPHNYNRTVSLKLDGLRLGAHSQATLYLEPDFKKSIGFFQFNKIKCTANVADDHVTLTVERVGGTFESLNTFYQTVDGTALAPRDYIATAGSLNWGNGDSSPKTFQVPLTKGQAIDGSSRTFSVLITGFPGDHDQETVTIFRTAVPTVSVEATTAQTLESGGAPGVFTLIRTGDISAPLKVKFELSGSAENGSDYQFLPQKKVIEAGQASASVSVHPIDLGITGGKRTLKLTLFDNSDYSISGDGTAKVKILLDR